MMPNGKISTNKSSYQKIVTQDSHKYDAKVEAQWAKALREGIKRLLLIALVIGCFFLFDSLMDYAAHNYLPALFNCVLYPIDVAGVIEYIVAFAVLSVSYKKGIEWLSTGTFATFVFTLVIIAQKLILAA